MKLTFSFVLVFLCKIKFAHGHMAARIDVYSLLAQFLPIPLYIPMNFIVKYSVPKIIFSYTTKSNQQKKKILLGLFFRSLEYCIY